MAHQQSPLFHTPPRWLAVLALLLAGIAAARAVADPPAISEQPQSLTNVAGTTAIFTVVASGSEPLAYQWYFQETNLLADATNEVLVLPAVMPGQAGGYSVVITNDFDSITSVVAMLTVVLPPTITVEPQSRTNVAGTEATFTVAASGTEPLAWQWLFNGTNLLADATNTTLTLSSLQPAQAGEYSAIVTNDYGSATSAVAVLTVVVPPFITAQPQGRTNLAGTEASFAVTASGTEPLRFQWYFQTTNVIAGATNALLVLSNVQHAQGGDYSVVVTNDHGSATSAAAILTVVEAPFIVTPPQSRTNVPGTEAVFMVAASGTGPLRYQWFFQGANLLADATNATLTLTSVQPAQAGEYSAIVTNDYGSATSAVAVLTVVLPPSITTQPQSQTNFMGADATFTVTAAGTGPLFHQWFFQSTNLLPGATGATLALTNLQPAQAGEYSVLVTNDYGSITSAAATLVVIPPPVITQPPAGLTVTQGHTVTFTVVADSAAPVSYQWFFAGGALNAQTNATLVLSNVAAAQAGDYAVAAANGAGAVTSAVATLTVLVPPVILTPPMSRTNLPGSDATFTVIAAGTEPLGYQWFFSETNLLADQTESSLTLSNVTPASAGDYHVVVSNVAGVTASATATLTIVLPPEIVTPPASLIVTQGGTAVLTVAATGDAPLAYQWFFQGTNLLADATSATLALSNAQPAQAGGYVVTVTNAYGAVTSAPAMLTIVFPPAIVASPESRTNLAGTDATFTVVASGTEPLAYQWFLQGTNLVAGATNAALVLSNIQPAETGEYSVIVTNDYGFAASAPATLTIVEPPAITAPPQSRTNVAGTEAVFTVTASGTGPLRFQWFFQGTNFIGEATNATLVLANVQLAQAGDYSVTVTNDYGSVTSAAAALTVVLPPSITAQPQSRTNLAGTEASFTVSASGTETLLYQWVFQGTNAIAGATNAVLILPDVQHAQAGDYSAVVTNDHGSVISAVATLTVVDPPLIVTPPQSRTNVAGTEAAFTVTASGTEPLRFQWFFQGTSVIADATNATLVLSNVQPAQAGDYSVTVTNDYGSASSAAATLTVVLPPSITTQPQSRTNLAGTTASFTVAASGTAPLAYQWFFNGTNLLPGATSASLVLTNLQLAQAGDYTVVVTNNYGTATSAPATLTVLPSADLTLHLNAPTGPVAVGSLVAFTLNITNRGPSSASGITLISHLSPAMQFLSASTTLGACTNDGNAVTCLVSSLAAGARFAVTLNANAAAGTNLCSATVIGAEIDPVPGDNAASGLVVGTRSLAPYSNGDSIFLEEINPNAGSVYPSTIVVSGLTAQVFKATVTLHGLAHTWPDDLDVLLVGPGGQKVLLMSDSGLDNSMSDVTLTFDDDAASGLPDGDPGISTGTFRPSNYGVFADTFAAPAPSGPYTTNLASFRNTNPNGSWSLYVYDDSPENGGFLADGWSLTLVTSDPIADFTVGQRANLASLPVGSNLTYTLTVTNRGPAHSAVTVIDTLPPSVNFVSATPSQGACSNLGQIVTCALGGLLNAATAQVTVVVTTTADGLITNLVSVAGAQVDLVSSNNSAPPLVTAVLPVAGIAVLATAAPSPALLAQPMAYHFTTTNLGPDSAANVVLTNRLSAQMMFVSATPSQGSCSNAAGVVSCSLGVIPAGAAAFVTVVGVPQTMGLHSNSASIASSQIDLSPADNSTNIVVTAIDNSDLALTVAPPVSNVFLGQNWPLSLTVSNRGPGVSDAALTAMMPASVQFVSAVASQGACTNAPGLISCQFGSLAPTQTVTLALVTRPVLLGSVSNTLTVTGTLPDGNLSNNTAVATATVLTNADLELHLADAPDPAWLGEIVLHTLTLTNRGPNAAASVTITNPLPTNFSFISASPSQGSCARIGNTIVCSLGNLSPGARADVTVTTRALTEGFITNTARAIAPELDGNTANNLATQVTRVVSPSGQFESLAPITIPGAGAATPYPSTITVSGLTAAVFRVRVSLTNLTHSYPDDLDVLLVGPEGQSVLLLSDAGGDFGVNNLTMTFDEDAVVRPGDSSVLPGGLMRPIDHEPGADLFPTPAPPGPYTTNLAVFRDTNPNGVWSLYVFDDAVKDAGLVAGGWGMAFSTLEPIADVVVAQRVTPNPVATSNTVLLSYALTNFGPATATGLRLTNVLDPSLGGLAFVSSQGACTNDAGAILCDLGALAPGAHASVTIEAVGTAAAAFTNRVTLQASQRDLLPDNNTTELLVEVDDVPVITQHPIDLTIMNGDTAILPAAATGSAPLHFQWQRNGVNVPGATSAILIISNASPLNSGNYRLLATNRVGAALSDAAFLRVLGPPTISDLADLVIDEDTSTGIIPFTVEDSETAPELIVVTGSSSNTNLVPDGAIVFDGTDTNRTLVVTPLPDAYGETVISVTARDTDNAVTTRAFLLTVRSVNDPPSITSVPAQTVDEDTPVVVGFLVDDVETAPDEAAYYITSTNPSLIPTNNVVFSGTNTLRTATITPATNVSGTTMVTVHFDDGDGGVASASFLVTVAAVNDPPALDALSDLTIDEDSGLQTLPLTGIGSGAADEDQQLQIAISSSNPALIPPPAIAYTSPSNGASLTFTPLTNAHGTAVITITVTDGGTTNHSFSRTFTVAVRPVNDPPLLALAPLPPIEEDTALLAAISISDADDEATALALTALSLNTNLVAQAGLLLDGTNANRSLLITPVTNASGSVTLRLIATDSHGAATTNDVALTVLPVNDPPTLNAIADRNIAEDAPAQSVPLSGLSSGPAGEPEAITIIAVSGNPALIPSPAVLHTNATGVLTFRPNTNAAGSALITVTVTDTEGAQTVRTFTVTVGAANDAPAIASISPQSTDEDTPLIVPIVIGDAETPLPLLTVTGASSNPALIAATNLFFDGSGSNRTITLAPRPEQSGTANITLTVSDGVASNSTAFALTVAAVNDRPTLNPIPAYVTNSASGNPAHVVAFNGISSGATNESQTLTVTATSDNPGFLPNPAVAYTSPGTNGTLTLRPGNNTTGTALITVVVSDGSLTVTQTFTANVKAAGNVLPTISIITNRTTPEDTAVGPISFTVRDAETTASNLVLTAVSLNPALLPPANITLGGASTNRTLTLLPATNRFGSAAVRLTVSDASFGSSNMMFTLTVSATNDVPFISSLTNRSTPEDTALQVPVTVGDVETAAGALVVSAISGNQTLVPNANLVVGGSGSNRVVFVTPATNQNGAATITVRVSDGMVTNTSAFTLTVNAINDPPTISSLAGQSTPEETPLGPLAFNVGDVETAANALTPTAVSSNPSLIDEAGIVFGGGGANRGVTLTPLPDATGSALITLIVTDGGGASASNSFLFTVTPVNDLPTLDPIADARTNEGFGPILIALTGVGAGAGDSNQVPSVSAATSDTNLLHVLGIDYSGGSTGLLALQPVAGASGTATVTVTVIDGAAADSFISHSFSVSINAAPTLGYVPDQTTLESTVIGPIAFTIGDLDHAADQLVVTIESASPLLPPGSATLDGSNANRTVVLTPAAGLSGVAFVSVTVTDAEGASRSGGFFLTVLPVNAPPTLDAISNVVINAGATRIITLTGISSGATNEMETVALTARSSDSNLVAIASLVYSNETGTAELTLLASGTGGSAIITVTADDGQPVNAVTEHSFEAVINAAPLFSSISNQTTPEDTAFTIEFTVDDDFTAPGSLVLTGYSSSPIVAPEGITFGGSGSNRTVTVLGLTNQHGPVVITIATTDEHGLPGSNSFELVIESVPDLLDIVTQPQTVVAAVGGNAAFHCLAASAVPLHYQWRKAGVDILDATNTTLVLTNLQSFDAGVYSCFVTNADGDTELSQPASLFVFAGPSIVSITHTGIVAEVFYTTLPGSTNTLEFKSPLDATNWISLETTVATNLLMRALDSSATNASGFYRIRTEF